MSSETTLDGWGVEVARTLAANRTHWACSLRKVSLKRGIEMIGQFWAKYSGPC